jgi:hypothetical protein
MNIENIVTDFQKSRIVNGAYDPPPAVIVELNAIADYTNVQIARSLLIDNNLKDILLVGTPILVIGQLKDLRTIVYYTDRICSVDRHAFLEATIDWQERLNWLILINCKDPKLIPYDTARKIDSIDALPISGLDDPRYTKFERPQYRCSGNIVNNFCYRFLDNDHSYPGKPLLIQANYSGLEDIISCYRDLDVLTLTESSLCRVAKKEVNKKCLN